MAESEKLTEKELRAARRLGGRQGRFGPKTSKAELLFLLDGTVHQGLAMRQALEDIVDCYDRDDGADMAVAMAHAHYVVAQVKAGRKI
jgi:hypothetical protein